jgi:L-arabinose isomerase
MPFYFMLNFHIPGICYQEFDWSDFSGYCEYNQEVIMEYRSAYEVWFVTGSQHLYGDETLKQVAEDAKKVAAEIGDTKGLPVPVRFKSVVTTPEEILKVCESANTDPACIGIITWMHTFSPAKMWIRGLKSLQKPLLQLHTQYNREIPWSDIDMDFMNLNQTAHGGREFGFIGARMGMNRKVVVGHWSDSSVIQSLHTWIRAARGAADSRGMKIARFGDNMREVAVTEGDKVEAEIRFGYSVNGYSLEDLGRFVDQVPDGEVARLLEECGDRYAVSPELQNGGEKRDSLADALRVEAGMRAFLQDGGFSAFTTTFENLSGLKQLPGLAVQRLMSEGYGFGAEGDWKTAALVRTMKVMGDGLPGGTSFMEDYTYHFSDSGDKVLGAHMLEVCESIAGGTPSLIIRPLSIGGKEDPVRLVFSTEPGPGLNASIVDMGDRFRMIVNTVTVVKPEQDMPKLPVARVMWAPDPDLKTAAAAWIYAGGAHHTGFSQSVTVECLQDFADMSGTEFLLIGSDTDLRRFRQEILWNEACYRIIS